MTSNKTIHKGLYYVVGLLGFLLVITLSISFYKQAQAGEDRVLDIHTWQAQNGVPVFFVAAKQLPMVDIVLLFDAGSRRDGEQLGLARMTNLMMDKGSATLNTNAIAEQFDRVGARFSASVDRDKAVLGLRTLSKAKYFDPAVKVFSEVVSSPTFPKTDFNRAQQLSLISLQQDEQEPGSIASRTFFHLLYN